MSTRIPEGCRRVAGAILLVLVVGSVGGLSPSPRSAVAQTSPKVGPPVGPAKKILYAADVLEVNRSSEQQGPYSVAAVHVPADENLAVGQIAVDIELEPATLETADGHLPIPAPLVRYDEAEVRLISPRGEVFHVSEALHYQLPDGGGPVPYPVSKIEESRWFRFRMKKKPRIVAPTLDVFGLPTFDDGGRLETEGTLCRGRRVWGHKKQRSYATACEGERELFKRTHAPTTIFSSSRIRRTMRVVAPGSRSWGTWLVVVRDTQPLLQDRLAGLPRYDPATLDLLSVADVPRFQIRRASLRVDGVVHRVGGAPIVTRGFGNETNVFVAPGAALRGATRLVASGLRFSEATVFLQIRRVGGRKTVHRAVLTDPQGRSFLLAKSLTTRGEPLEILLGGAEGRSNPFTGRLIDGTWQLRLYDRRGRDVSHQYNLTWGMTVTGPSSDRVEVQSLPNPTRVRSGETYEFSFGVNAPGRRAHDLEIVVDSNNHLAFRNVLHVFAPDGSLVARSCRAEERPFLDRCLRTDQLGRTLRIPLDASRMMHGVWRVRWQPERAPEQALSEQSGDSAELVGDCPENARLFGEKGSAAGAGQLLNAESVMLSGLRLGLSETRLTPELFAHRVLDEAGGRGQGGFVVHRETGSTLYPMHRAAFEREFWGAYGEASDAGNRFLSGMDPRLGRVLGLFEDAAPRDSLRAHLAARAGVFGAWAPRGAQPALSATLSGLAARSRSLEAMLRLDEPARRIQMQDRRSWMMNDDDVPPTSFGLLMGDLAVDLASGLAGRVVGAFLTATFTDWADMPFEFAKSGVPGGSTALILLDHGARAVGVDLRKPTPKRYCDVEEGCTAFAPQSVPNDGTDPGQGGDDGTGGEDDGGAGNGAPGGTGGGSGGESGDADDGSLGFCDPSSGVCEVDCAPHQDTCGEGSVTLTPMGQALLDTLLAGNRRSDSLTLRWGSLAPLVQCGSEQSCEGGLDPERAALLAGISLDDRIDPYIDCGAESGGVCNGVEAPIALCRDWGSGFVDPAVPL